MTCDLLCSIVLSIVLFIVPVQWVAAESGKGVYSYLYRLPI